MPLMAITRLRVRSWRYLPIFFLQAFRSTIQAKAANGNLVVSVLSEANRTFWTRTAWADEQAMSAYMSPGVHRKVMRSLAKWCDETFVAQWTQATLSLPSWEEAHHRMQSQGRPSRVDQPTPALRAFQIPAPLVRRSDTPCA